MPYADVDLAAVRSNITTMLGHAGTAVCAVVKADAYGHGAAAVAAAAIEGGATWLAVATAHEALAVASAVPDGTPILVLSERPSEELELLAADRPSGLRLTVGSTFGLEFAASLGAHLPVHLEIDTGMHRMGADPSEAMTLARAIVDAPGLVLEGVWTHMAVADEPADPFTDIQLDRFDRVLADLGESGLRPPLVHAANSAAAIAYPRARGDFVRMGITLYGVPPSKEMEGTIPLAPAMTIRAPVTALRTIDAGETVSYGRRWTATERTRIATVPVGYADGVRRSANRVGMEVLIGGVRRPVVGTVTMDQIMVVVDDDVRIGDEVVVIGSQGGERITVSELAGRLDPIGYEVLTGIGARIERRYT